MADQSSRFYDTRSPDAPRVLAEYRGPHHGLIRPGFQVVYENPAWRQPDGSYETGGLDGPFTVTELIPVQAILDEGAYEVSADNLRWLDDPGEEKSDDS
jgi:hypothetical protein